MAKMAKMTCQDAHTAIVTRQFAEWRGLPSGCTAEALFGVGLDDSWGKLTLGEASESARSRLLELDGYYRPLAYVREGAPVAFDAMNPKLDGDAAALFAHLGAPDATLDWVFGTVAMAKGERVFASRGITLFVNPENQAILFVTLYAPMTADAYRATIRPPREKRPHKP